MSNETATRTLQIIEKLESDKAGALARFDFKHYEFLCVQVIRLNARLLCVN